MIKARKEKNCWCDLRITNALRCQSSMISTIPISEIPRLLQPYVDEGIGLSCFSRDTDNATLSLMNRVCCFQTFYVVFPKDPFYRLFC